MQTSAALDPRAARSREKLRGALLALVRDQRLDLITIADITAKAGVGHATFFRHYRDKHELWWDIADGLVEALLGRLTALADRRDPRKIADELCAHVAANRETLSAVLAQGAEGVVREDLIRRAVARASRITRPDFGGLPRDLALLHATNAAFGILVWWLERYDKVPREAMVGIIERLVVRPLTI